MTSQKGSRFKNFDIIIFFKHNQSLYEAFAEDRMSKSLSILKINIKVCGNRHIGGQTAIPNGRRDTRSLKMPGTFQVLTKLSLFFAKTSSNRLILMMKGAVSNFPFSYGGPTGGKQVADWAKYEIFSSSLAF